MAKLFNRAKMTTATTGSGTVTLGSASNGFQTFAAAGVLNGDVVQYVIEEGANFEIGTGTYSSTGTSLTRSPTESSNSNAAITLAGQATVSITAVADDLNRLQHGGSDKVTVSSTGASVTGNLAVSGTVDGRDVASDGSKLDGIESGATGDQTASEIRALVESASDSNVFTDADHSKLNGIEAGATGDQTNAEIRAAVEAATDSNVFTDADHTKLNGIEANATADQTITAGGGLTGGGTGNVTISHSDTSSQASVNGSGRTYIQDITLDTYGHVTGLATATETVVNTDTNTIPNNATITLSAGGALTGGGNFTTDQSSNETITFNHADTSSQSSVNNSGRTYIQDITLDTYGHITGITSATETVVNTDTNTTYSAGSGLGLSGTTFSHSDTSSQGSVNNSGATVIQDVTLDTYGHVTGLGSHTLTLANLGYTGATNANNYTFPYTVSASASNNTVVQRTGSGYIFANFFNTTPNDVSSGVTKICCETGNDGYIRHATAAAVRSFLNVADGANNITNNNQLTNGAGYTTFTANQSLNTGSNVTHNQIYANDWFRVNGADGIYWQSYGGGFQMTDTTWVRVYNNKAFVVTSTCQAVTFNSTSDERYKKDIVKIDDALDKLHRLNGYDFTFKDTDKKSSGVIAQEVQKVMPQLVNEGDDGRLTVQYGNMVGLLIEAIKEQQTQIDDLKAEIQSMKS
jgi:hypothetical protein